MNLQDQKQDRRSAHQDEPIIIDNGATFMDLLPSDHEDTLEQNTDDWKITGHNQHLYLWLNKFGPVKLTAGKPVIVEFWLGNTEKAGDLTIAWTDTAGPYGTTTFKSVSAAGKVLKWEKYKLNGNGRWGLRGHNGADYRIKKITYSPAGGEPVTWTNPALDLTKGDVDVHLKSVPN